VPAPDAKVSNVMTGRPPVLKLQSARWKLAT